MIINFITPTKMSLINLTTIGDSEKRNDTTKIGQFSSGQAYATALCLRNSIELSITVDGQDRYSYSTKELYCEKTGKSKEIIVLNYNNEQIETAFALQLGYNWETWMILREFFSNMLDEGGYYQEGYAEAKEGTIVTLDFPDDSEFAEIWRNKHLYINEQPPLFDISNSVQALENKEEYLRIYKQNILVYEDKEIESIYSYNIKFGEIDERRILRDIWSIKRDIANAVIQTKNKEYLNTIVGKDLKADFLRDADSWYGVGEVVIDVVNKYYEENGDVNTYPFILKSMRAKPDCKINGKVIRTVEDSIWNYSSNITVESKPIPAEKTIKEKITDLYKIDLSGIDITTAKLKGSSVVADKYNKTLILDELFDLDEDFNHFIVEYTSLTMEGNVILNLAEKIKELIRK